jgi:hypothetical protein
LLSTFGLLAVSVKPYTTPTLGDGIERAAVA